MSEFAFGILSKIAKGKRGVTYKPEDLVLGGEQEHYRLLTAGNIQDGITTTNSYAKVSPRCVSQNQLISPDEILVCMSNGSKRLVGKSSRLRSADSKRYCVGAFCSTFTPNEDADPEFVFQIFQSENFKKHVSDALEGSAINNLKNSTIESFEVPIPPLPEQKKIAEILSGIDRLVEAKKRRVKQRKLLLKSAFEDATKKEASDNFVSLSGLGRWRGGGTPSKSIPEYWGGVIPWVSPKDMKGRKISCSQDAITQEAIENSTASLIPKDSILFVVRSGILRHTFPIALATREVAINQDLKALTVSDHCIPNFLFHYLCCRSEEMLASCMKSGTTVESIDTNSLQNYQVPVISIQEQLRLSLFAESITMAIEAEESQVESLKMLKSSLGSDLLSGRKRVSI